MNILGKNKHTQDNKAKVPDHFFNEIDIEFLIHELKGPLSVIETGMQMLLNKGKKFGQLSLKQKKIIKRSLRNTIKARELIYGLLEIGRSEANCFEHSYFMLSESLYPCVLDSLETSGCNVFEGYSMVEDEKVMTGIFKENGIELNVSDKAWKTHIYQDEFKFRQIAGNLIRNALQYKKNTIYIQAEIHDDLLVIDVADDGPGVAPEDHKTVFERYRQIVKPNGLKNRAGHGLGLSASYILAKRLKGDIEIMSRKDRGAVFRLTLPRMI